VSQESLQVERRSDPFYATFSFSWSSAFFLPRADSSIHTSR
jgi:hypothetical protein